MSNPETCPTSQDCIRDEIEEISNMLKLPSNKIQSLVVDRFGSSHLADIAEMEKDIYDMLKAVRYLHNCVIPVTRLPTEILCRIFELSVNSYYGFDGLGLDRLKGGERHVLDLSHICRHWRNASLQSAMLWSNISFIGQWTTINEEFLRRSESAPLNIAIGPGKFYINNRYLCPQEMFGIGPLLTSHNHRVVSIKFVVPKSWLTTLLEKLPPSICNLENFYVKVYGYEYEPFQRLPTNMHSHQYSRLRRLALDGFVFTPPETFNNLTAIRLINTSYAIPEAPSMTLPFLLKVLEHSPKLELLEFSGHRLRHTTVVKRLQVIHLPHLTTILLKDCDPVLILSHLSLSSTVHATIHVNKDHIQSDKRVIGIHSALPLDLSDLQFLHEIVELRLDLRDYNLILQGKNALGGSVLVIDNQHQFSSGDNPGHYIESLPTYLDLSHLLKVTFWRTLGHNKVSLIHRYAMHKFYRHSPHLLSTSTTDWDTTVALDFIKPLERQGLKSQLLCPHLTRVNISARVSNFRYILPSLGYIVEHRKNVIGSLHFPVSDRGNIDIDQLPLSPFIKIYVDVDIMFIFGKDITEAQVQERTSTEERAYYV